MNPLSLIFWSHVALGVPVKIGFSAKDIKPVNSLGNGMLFEQVRASMAMLLLIRLLRNSITTY